MASKPRSGDSIPLSVVSKHADARENGVSEAESGNESADQSDRVSMADDISARLRELREQVQTLKASIADAQQALISTVSDATVTAGENSRATVRAYPISSIVIAGLLGIVIGRLSSRRTTIHEGTFDEWRNRLTNLATELPPQIKASLRSTLS